MFKKYSKNYFFVLTFCCNLVLIILCDFAEGVVVNNNEHLQSELMETLNTDNGNVAAERVVVQSLWTQDNEKAEKTEKVIHKVNAQNRISAALTAETAKTVGKETYDIAGATEMRDLKALEDFANTAAEDIEVITTLPGEQSNLAAQQEEYVISSSNNTEDQESVNVITANIFLDSEIDARKLQRLEISKRRTREMLVLKYIEEDFSFTFGQDVNEWKHIVHAGQEYFIGRRTTDLLIIRKEGSKYDRAVVLDIGHVITCLESYTFWNLKHQQQEGVIIIATADTIMWYCANEDTMEFQLYWNLMMGSNITSLRFFTLHSKDYLAISSNHSFLAGHNALNVYQYELETKEFWIDQRLQLEFPCKELTILDTGREVILAIPQNHTAIIYSFNPHESDFSQIRFQIKRTVVAEGILTIAGFKMGGHSYLALTGYQPQILVYQQGDFVSKTILDNNFGLVELFFPLPVRTYRDDLILLVQHSVDFSSHTLTVVETLIWDGEAFDTSIPVPCHLGDHVVYGVGCMLDLHRNEGLKGAALLKSGNNISVVVPRHKAESGLFHFHTELLEKNSELFDLQEMYDFLKDWVKEQDDLVTQAETFLSLPNEEIIKQHQDLTAIELLNTKEFQFNGEVGEIYLNEYKWTPEDSDIHLDLIIQDIEDIEKSLESGRQRRNLNDVWCNELDLEEVFVEDLVLENVNGQQFFIQNGDLNFEGTIQFSYLHVIEKLTTLRKGQWYEEYLTLNSNIEFEQINGVHWHDIKNNLIFTNQKQHFEELVVREVLVEDSLSINSLNRMNFPDDFMLTCGPISSIVRAEKYFVNTLVTSCADVYGYINGKNFNDVITLNMDQEWEGMPTFRNLEVSEVLELNGKFLGRDQDKFPKNVPTLQESNIVNATCHFRELVVNGPIYLEGKLDDQPLEVRFSDLILKTKNPAEQIIIPSRKSFDLISFPKNFHLENNTINEIPVEHFVTINSQQTLNITSLEGEIYFSRLTLNGSYDGVKIDDLLEEVILLENPIDLSTTEIIFAKDIKASSVSILGTINNQSIEDNLQTLYEDLIIETAEFEKLQTVQAEFYDDIVGEGKLCNIESHASVCKTSSYKPEVGGNIFLNNLILEKGIQTDELHGIKAELVLDFLNEFKDPADLLFQGKIHADRITVTGDVQLNKLNGVLFEEELQSFTIKLNHPNTVAANVTFKDALIIVGGLNVLGDFRGTHLPTLIDDIVTRESNKCINIRAPKSFLHDVLVLENTRVQSLNSIPIENILLKSEHIHFNGSMHLRGNLEVRNIHLQGTLNNLNIQDLQNLIYFDEDIQNFVLKNVTQFNNPLFLEDLTVKGNLNGLENLPEFFENLIYKNQFCRLQGKITFRGRVRIENGAHIKNLNGQNLEDLFNNLVFIHGSRPVVIQTPIIFKGSIHANDLVVRKQLSTQKINGCNITEWLNDSLRIDQDQNVTHLVQFAAGSIDGNSLSAQYVNDKDLSRIITINTPQTFRDTVKFSNLSLEGLISSNGLTNNLNLEKEFNNTLMTHGYQHIALPLTIQTVVVLGNLEVRGPVNGDKYLGDVATLREDLVFESPMYFRHVYSRQVIVNDLVTGLDLNKWFKSALQSQSSKTQYVTGKWSTKYLAVKNDAEKDLEYNIEGFKPRQLYSDSGTEVASEDKEICLVMQRIWQNMAKRPVLIKYVEEQSNMDLDDQLKNLNETLSNVFYLNSNREQFLLINLKCQTLIYKWLAAENTFLLVNTFLSGPIDEIYVIPAFGNSTKLQFMTNFDASTRNTNCTLRSVNKWKVENNSFVLDNQLSELSDLHNDSMQTFDFDYKTKKKFELPRENARRRYRFIPFGEEIEIELVNGEQLDSDSGNDFQNETRVYLFLQTSNFEDPSTGSPPSILNRNNISLIHSFTFSDFKGLLENILIDLHQRLNQEINIMQLAMPETDLYDEHLWSDLMAIMKEFQKPKNIYPPHILNISFYNITKPDDPSKYLAARVVNITWPVVKQIVKIRSYLKSNQSHYHPLCSNITDSLGLLIKDILALANHSTSKLNVVIERLRTFEEYLKTFVNTLQNYNDMDSDIRTFGTEQPKQSATKRDVNVFGKSKNDLIFMLKSALPPYRQGEMLSLLVGSVSNPQRLLAVTTTKPYLAANSNHGIYLYLEYPQDQLYQYIAAIQPRSLQQLRIKQETLLLYIQDCCQVQIWKYRVSQGFTMFAEINAEERILRILTITVPAERASFKHFLVLLLENKVKFFEFVVVGFNYATDIDSVHTRILQSVC